MTDEEIKQQLTSSFDLWKTQVMRLLRQAAVSVKHVLNSDRINGFSLAELIAIIRGEVKTHEDNSKKPHGETLTSLGGMTKANYDAAIVNLFPKDAVPVSVVPLIEVSIAAGKVTLPETAIVYQGRKLKVPSATLTLTTQARQYIKVNITNPGQDETAAFMVTAAQTETLSLMIIGFVDYANDAYSATLLKTVRIGSATIRNTPRGQSIPASTGTPAAPGSINAGWMS